MLKSETVIFIREEEYYFFLDSVIENTEQTFDKSEDYQQLWSYDTVRIGIVRKHFVTKALSAKLNNLLFTIY